MDCELAALAHGADKGRFTGSRCPEAAADEARPTRPILDNCAQQHTDPPVITPILVRIDPPDSPPAMDAELANLSLAADRGRLEGLLFHEAEEDAIPYLLV